MGAPGPDLRQVLLHPTALRQPTAVGLGFNDGHLPAGRSIDLDSHMAWTAT